MKTAWHQLNNDRLTWKSVSLGEIIKFKLHWATERRSTVQPNLPVTLQNGNTPFTVFVLYAEKQFSNKEEEDLQGNQTLHKPCSPLCRTGHPKNPVAKSSNRVPQISLPCVLLHGLSSPPPVAGVLLLTFAVDDRSSQHSSPGQTCIPFLVPRPAPLP